MVDVTYPRAVLLAAFFSLALIARSSMAQSSTKPASSELPSVPWDVAALQSPPKFSPAEGYRSSGLQAILVDGPPYKGRPTRFFAWYGVPERKSGKNVPGIVLVHGGGGTAFGEWVKLWNDRGYAAIAMDTGATMPPPQGGAPITNPQGGPKGSDHCFSQIDDALEDQWAYHGVASIILSHSLLRSLPGVDPHRTGVTGISWGGYLISIAVGVDDRFKFAVPIYGGGFLVEDSHWTSVFEGLGEAKTRRWKAHWDPARYLPAARMPILWINGDMDHAFSLKVTTLSMLAARGDQYLSIQPNMPHGHEPGQLAKEVPVFAEQVLHQGRPIAKVRTQGCRGSYAWAKFADVGRVASARCAYTAESGRWMHRKWVVANARWDDATCEASFSLPSDATAFYFVLTDDRGLMASSVPQVRE